MFLKYFSVLGALGICLFLVFFLLHHKDEKKVFNLQTDMLENQASQIDRLKSEMLEMNKDIMKIRKANLLERKKVEKALKEVESVQKRFLSVLRSFKTMKEKFESWKDVFEEEKHKERDREAKETKERLEGERLEGERLERERLERERLDDVSAIAAATLLATSVITEPPSSVGDFDFASWTGGNFKVKDVDVDSWKFVSSLGEDEVILDEYFVKESSALIEGFFVEVGASDGKTNSASLIFEKYLGWSGILVEGCPLKKENLVSNRPSHSVLKVLDAVCAADESHVNYSPECQIVASGIQVPCVPLTWITAKAHLPFVDFLNVRVDGNEFQVLSSINFSQLSIRVITLRIKGMKTHDLTQTQVLLEGNGFVSRGLCCGYSVEIWENKAFSRVLPETRESVFWSASGEAAKKHGRLRPCEKIPVLKAMEIQEANPEVLEYAKSFESKACA